MYLTAFSLTLPLTQQQTNVEETNVFLIERENEAKAHAECMVHSEKLRNCRAKSNRRVVGQPIPEKCVLRSI